MKKNVLITGASKGIGRAIALDLASAGYNIGINYNSSESAAFEVKALVESLGARALLIKADVGMVKEINSMFDSFMNEFGSIDLLVNNAGVSVFSSFLKVTEEMWDKVTNIDWKGTYFCAQRAALEMKESGNGGVILNISSNQKDGCWPTASVYGPSKAAIAKFTKHAAYELARYGIRVIAIAPGYTDVGWPSENIIHEAKDKIPLKRFAEPSEIARVIRYLVSSDFSYMTGSCLDIDGGSLLPIVTENDLDADEWASTQLDKK